MKMKMRAIAMGLALAFLASFSIAMPAGGQGGGAAKSSCAVINGKVYAFEKIAEGVYYTTSSSPRGHGWQPHGHRWRSRRVSGGLRNNAQRRASAA